MNIKQCTACRKVTERGKNDECYCRYHKKYIKNIAVCPVEKYYQRECCPICHDILNKGELCSCKRQQWTEEKIRKYKSIYG